MEVVVVAAVVKSVARVAGVTVLPATAKREIAVQAAVARRRLRRVCVRIIWVAMKAVRALWCVVRLLVRCGW